MLDQLPIWARFVVVLAFGCAFLAVLFGAEWAFLLFVHWYDNRKKIPRAHPTVEEFKEKMRRKGYL